METTKLERLRRRFADEYMRENPGVPRQEAKRKVTPRAQVALSMIAINANAKKLPEAMGEMTPAFNEVAHAMGAFTNTYAEHGLREPRGS